MPLLGVFFLVCTAFLGIQTAKALEEDGYLVSEGDVEIGALLEAYQKGFLSVGGTLSDLSAQHPDYLLPKLLYADWMRAKSGLSPKNASAFQAIRLELTLRQKGLLTRNAVRGLIPKELIYLSPSYPYAIAVDLSLRRLYLFKNTASGLSLIGDQYVTIGRRGMDKFKEGDQKTPLGVYLLSSELQSTSLNPHVYGSQGAWTLDYPSKMDAFEHRTGHGIWLHGTPIDTMIRTPFSSNGCLSIADEDFVKLKRTLSVSPSHASIPIVISENLHWLTPPEHRQQARVWLSRLLSWKSDWESMDVSRYLSHYDPQLSINGMNYQRFSAYKTQVTGSKRYVRVTLGDIALLQNVQRDYVRAFFIQEYESDNYHSVSKRDLVFKNSEAGYRILLEGEPRRLNLLTHSSDKLEALAREPYAPSAAPILSSD